MPRALVCLCLAFLGCTATDSTNSDEHRDLVLSAVADYESFGRVDDMNRWVPTLCRIVPAQARVSEASRRTPHAGKLFFLYAKDRASYVNAERTKSPIGQVIVKEAWVPQEVNEAQLEAFKKRHFMEPAVGKDGKQYIPGDKSGLFVMMKLDPADPGTDEGWIYGTVDSKGQEVFEAGRIPSCMRCHRDDTVDKLFGLQE